ncbi:MAG: hypothetical protein MJZ77_03135 [Bacteroidales bacterium]|nr:hypothetical protein [Bacteroidales bacterium]
MKKFFPIKIIETRWTTVAIEAESLEEAEKKCEAVPGVFLNQCCESSVLVACAGTSGTFEEVNLYDCYDKHLRRVTEEDVIRSEQHGELYFHEHVVGKSDCVMCALTGDECSKAICTSGERQDGRSGYFSKEEEEEGA